jgi:hypothetical protein
MEAYEGRDLPREERKYCFVALVPRTCRVPNPITESQVVPFPLSDTSSGVVDCSTRPSKMAAYTYFEMDGVKGRQHRRTIGKGAGEYLRDDNRTNRT